MFSAWMRRAEDFKDWITGFEVLTEYRGGGFDSSSGTYTVPEDGIYIFGLKAVIQLVCFIGSQKFFGFSNGFVKNAVDTYGYSRQMCDYSNSLIENRLVSTLPSFSMLGLWLKPKPKDG